MVVVVSGGEAKFSCTGVVDFDGDLSSIALKGRGGAMVPNSMLANCLALPPPARSSSSSSDESNSEPAADQSSSSGRARDLGSSGRDAVNVDLAFSCCARRWKGFVVCTSDLGELTAVVGKAGDSVAWLSVD